jgi:hypothetical protein
MYVKRIGYRLKVLSKNIMSNNNHYQDIFYLKSRDLSPKIWEEICRDAKSKCYSWKVDHMPSWTRKEIDLDFDEALKYLYTETIHFSVIHRRGFENWKNKDTFPGEWCLEISFCTMARKKQLPTTPIKLEGDLFVWIYLDEKWIDYFLEKYKLITKNGK